MGHTEHEEEATVGSLEGPEPIVLERVIEQEDGRTISRMGVTIAFLDSPEYLDKSILWGENPIPVIDSTGFTVGFGSIYIYKEDNRLMADLFADYASPDRLTLETNSYPLYAYPIGFAGSEAVHIFAIKLDTGRPGDVRLQPL